MLCLLVLQFDSEDDEEAELFDAREMLTPPQDSHITDVMDAMALSISCKTDSIPPDGAGGPKGEAAKSLSHEPVMLAKVTAKDFDILSVIGQGGYGKVCPPCSVHHISARLACALPSLGHRHVAGDEPNKVVGSGRKKKNQK